MSVADLRPARGPVLPSDCIPEMLRRRRGPAVAPSLDRRAPATACASAGPGRAATPAGAKAARHRPAVPWPAGTEASARSAARPGRMEARRAPRASPGHPRSRQKSPASCHSAQIRHGVRAHRSPRWPLASAFWVSPFRERIYGLERRRGPPPPPRLGARGQGCDHLPAARRRAAELARRRCAPRPRDSSEPFHPLACWCGRCTISKIGAGALETTTLVRLRLRGRAPAGASPIVRGDGHHPARLAYARSGSRPQTPVHHAARAAWNDKVPHAGRGPARSSSTRSVFGADPGAGPRGDCEQRIE